MFFATGAPSNDYLHPDYCPYINMGYGCEDDSLKKLKRYLSQSKQKKNTEDSCNNAQCISTVTCSSPLLQSDDSAILPIFAATSTLSSSSPSLLSHCLFCNAPRFYDICIND